MSNARNIASIAGEDVLNASNEIVPVYACRAWVNFDGNDAFSPNPSTSAIRDSGNVSSIYQSGTGQYTVNFATEMPHTNYCIASINAAYLLGNSDFRWITFVTGVSTSSFTVQTNTLINGNSTIDSDFVNHAVFA